MIPTDCLAEFRVGHPREAVALLNQLRERNVPVHLSAPDSESVTTLLAGVDEDHKRLQFSADPSHPQLQRIVDADAGTAVAYLDAVKVQFDISGIEIKRGFGGCVLQATLPAELYRIQRRDAFRVRTFDREPAIAQMRHPSIPDMALALRIVDVSIGGCALHVPDDVPPLTPGVKLADVRIELDADTRFSTPLLLHHVRSLPPEPGVRVGCEWPPLPGPAERALQRYIDLTQKRWRQLAKD